MTSKPAILTLVRSGFFKGVGFSLGMMTTGLFAAAAAMNVFSPGEVISSAEINQNFAIAAPEGAIMAFYLADCPEGWTVADGENGTPDLRGRFIRGMDNMGGTAANIDPDSATRALGDEQLDAFQGHRHSPLGGSFWGHTAPGSLGPANGGYFWGSSSKTGDPTADASGIAPRTSSETRPRNVALIYCMRKN
jgi:hypothetical protein